MDLNSITTPLKRYPASRLAQRFFAVANHYAVIPSIPLPFSRRTWILCLPSRTIRSHTFRGVATTFSSSTEWEIIKCRSTCSRSSRKSKLWQPANVSTLKSATAPGCNTAPQKSPHRSSAQSRTSLSTMTSPLNYLRRCLRLFQISRLLQINIRKLV